MNGIRLTSNQRAHLERQLEFAKDVRVYRRTLAILEHDAGIPIVRIAENMNVDRSSVHRWIAAFRESLSPCSLLEKPRNGRPRLWTDAHSQWMQALLETSPEELGYFAVNWTVPLLREHLRESIGQNVSDDTIRRALAALGYVWKRPRYVLAADPDRNKKRRIRRQIRDLPRRSVILAEDETDLLLFPPLRSAWGMRGKTTKVLLSGWNARRVIYGMINIRTGSRLFLPHSSHKQQAFHNFLELLHEHYRGWTIALLLDENSGHTAKGSQHLAGQFGIHLLWLPNRSPELNPMDHLWGKAKDQICANTQRHTIDEQVTRFIDYLQILTPQEALNQAGILSPHFWLKDLL